MTNITPIPSLGDYVEFNGRKGGYIVPRRMADQIEVWEDEDGRLEIRILADEPIVVEHS